MNGYTPFQPQPSSRFKDWANKIHDFSVTRRRSLFSPGTLTTHTSQGTMHKSKAKGGGSAPSGTDDLTWV